MTKKVEKTLYIGNFSKFVLWPFFSKIPFNQRPNPRSPPPRCDPWYAPFLRFGPNLSNRKWAYQIKYNATKPINISLFSNSFPAPSPLIKTSATSALNFKALCQSPNAISLEWFSVIWLLLSIKRLYSEFSLLCASSSCSVSYFWLTRSSAEAFLVTE